MVRAVLAHVPPSSGASAGGGAIAEVVIGTVASLAVVGAMVWLASAHRRGKTQVLNRLGTFAERHSRLPGWAIVPISVQASSLLIAVFGMYWDISTHLDAGRDPGPFANASHYFILVGLFGILFAGVLAVVMPSRQPGPAAVPLPLGLHSPLGGVLILLCGAISLSGFPLDDIWHRLFGQDVTLWGPTHLLLFGAASLSVLGSLILLVEGTRSRQVLAGETPDSGPRQLLRVGFAGAFLIGLSTIQGEFDFAVPQFQLILHPVLLMLAAGIALTAARAYLGKGGALAAVLFFLVVRGLLSLLVTPLFGHSTLHFPLYLVEALVVELVALRVDPRRTVAFGAIAGAAVGTFGLAAEWGWSHVWFEIGWPAALLPEGAIAGFVCAVAGGLIGAFIGRALTAGEGMRPAPGRFVLPVAAVAILAVLVYSVPRSNGEPVTAQVTLTEVSPLPERWVNATVRLNPPDAAEENLRFINSTAWQGGEDHSPVAPLARVGRGVYATTEPIPVHGNWKTSIRLHVGRSLQGLPVYFPADPAIPQPEIPAQPTFTRAFIPDKQLLQREQKPGVSPILTVGSYIAVLLIAVLLVGSLALGLKRLQERLVARGVEVSAGHSARDPGRA